MNNFIIRSDGKKCALNYLLVQTRGSAGYCHKNVDQKATISHITGNGHDTTFKDGWTRRISDLAWNQLQRHGVCPIIKSSSAQPGFSIAKRDKTLACSGREMGPKMMMMMMMTMMRHQGVPLANEWTNEESCNILVRVRGELAMHTRGTLSTCICTMYKTQRAV